MGQNDIHRLQPPLAPPIVLGFDCPGFSSFRFLGTNFQGASTTIHRAFSIARIANCHTLVIEAIKAVGLIEEDNLELAAYGGRCDNLILRISFWRTQFCERMTVDNLLEDDLFGYLIIKKDVGLGFQSGEWFSVDRWYVFEGVFRQTTQAEQYIVPISSYNVAIGSKVCNLKGVLYCQQNSINKCCAHVALRSLLSRVMPGNDIGYETINNYAEFVPDEKCPIPGAGMSLPHIHNVLEKVGIKYDEYDLANKVPGYTYQKCVYDGVESGIGSLLFIHCGEDCSSNHVFPVFGHTFNCNTWVPDAESSYFMMGKGVGYMPSDLWTDDFLVHDDNFGCNFCVPRKHIADDKVFWAIALHKQGDCLSPRMAEAATLVIVSAWAGSLDPTNIWNEQIIRLLPEVPNASIQPRFVLRTVTISCKEYFSYIISTKDGRGNSEAPALIKAFSSMSLPDRLMVVELSLPQLFPANKRKIGEFVFDAGETASEDILLTINNTFCFGRMPGEYLYYNDSPTGKVLMRRKSKLTDHTKLLYT